jgi:hypothetical protein
MHGAVHEAQELGKKAINSNAAQRAKELGREAINSNGVQRAKELGREAIHSNGAQRAKELGREAIHSNGAQRAEELGREAIHSRAGQAIQDSGQHIVHGVEQRGKDAATAGTDVVHDAQQGKVDPKHLLNAGEKVGVAALAASPHALVAGVVGSAVKDEVMRKAPVSEGTRETIDDVTHPKRMLTDRAHQRVSEAVKNLPALELHGLSVGTHQPKTAAKKVPGQSSDHD